MHGLDLPLSVLAGRSRGGLGPSRPAGKPLAAWEVTLRSILPVYFLKVLLFFCSEAIVFGAWELPGIFTGVRVASRIRSLFLLHFLLCL